MLEVKSPTKAFQFIFARNDIQLEGSRFSP